MPQLVYSPDLAPSDLYLFPKKQAVSRRRKFETNEEVIVEVEQEFNDPDDDYKTYIITLQHPGSTVLMLGICWNMKEFVFNLTVKLLSYILKQYLG